MKAKVFFATMAMAFALTPALANDGQKEIEAMMKADINPDSIIPKDAGKAKNQFNIATDGDKVTITMNDPKLVRKGVDSTPFDAAEIRFTVNGKDNLCSVTVQGNKTTPCVIANPAKATGQPFVLNFYGYGKSAKGEYGFTMLNPDDPAVSFEPGSYQTKGGNKVNLETLVVSVVFYPDGTLEFGKKYGNRAALPVGINTTLASKAKK